MSASVHDYIRQQKFRRQKRRFYFFGALAAVVVIASVYFLFFSGLFDVRGIEVSGVEVITQSEVQAVVGELFHEASLFVLPHTNMLLFSSPAAADHVRAAFPRIADVSVKKRFWTRVISIAISERHPAGVSCVKATERCVYFDTSGIVFASAPTIASASLLRIEESDLRGSQFPYEQYTQELVEFVATAKKQMQEKAHATIISFSFMNGYGDVEARTQEGYVIFLNTAQGAEEQAQIFKNIIATEIKDKMPALEYIDLRVENRAYYKLR